MVYFLENGETLFCIQIADPFFNIASFLNVFVEKIETDSNYVIKKGAETDKLMLFFNINLGCYYSEQQNMDRICRSYRLMYC